MKPKYRLYMVVKKRGNDKGSWVPMGAAWENKDGKGLSLSVDFFPVRMPDREYAYILREPLPQEGSEDSDSFGEPEF